MFMKSKQIAIVHLLFAPSMQHSPYGEQSSFTGKYFVRPMVLLLLTLLVILLATMLYVPRQIGEMQKDFQAYQSRSLLPDDCLGNNRDHLKK